MSEKARRRHRKDTPKKKPRRWVKAFLAALTQCGSVTHAAKAAGVSKPIVYRHRSADSTFAEAWREALETVAATLETEAVRRARDGIEVPVIYRGRLATGWVDERGEWVPSDAPGAKEVPLTVKRYSDVLLIFLLKSCRPEKFRVREYPEGNGAPSVREVITTTRQEASEVLEALRAREVTGDGGP